MDPRLHTYLKHLLNTAHHLQGDRTMPAPLAEKMLADLHIQLEQRLTATLVDQLPEEDQEAFAALTATTPDQKAVFDFLNAKVPNAEAVIQVVLVKFEEDYISIVNRGKANAN